MTDEIERKPASENPWYVLMTIAGEQGEVFDEELHARNRRFWHGWIGEHVNNDSGLRPRTKVTRGVDISEFSKFDDEERAIWEQEVRRRTSSVFPDIPEWIDLGELVFRKPLACDGYCFPANLNLKNSLFEMWVSFDGVYSDPGPFGVGWNCSGAKFSGLFSICQAVLECGLDLGCCKFEDQCWATRLSVKNGIYASGSKFGSRAEFARLSVQGPARFRDCKFIGDTDFRLATISGEADFRDARFHGTLNFSSGTFEREVPKVFGAVLHEDTDWSKVAWPDPPEDGDRAHDHRRAYERLKLLMDGQKKTHDEQMFHRMELRCREVEEGFPRNLPSRAYGVVADYGWSFLRPLTALALVIFAGWLFLGPVLCWGGGSAAEVSACSFRGLYVSLSNTFGFLGLWRLIPPEVDLIMERSVWAMIVKVVQAVLGPVFLFFVLLALRNRYRMQ